MAGCGAHACNPSTQSVVEVCQHIVVCEAAVPRPDKGTRDSDKSLFWNCQTYYISC